MATMLHLQVRSEVSPSCGKCLHGDAMIGAGGIDHGIRLTRRFAEDVSIIRRADHRIDGALFEQPHLVTRANQSADLMAIFYEFRRD